MQTSSENVAGFSLVGRESRVLFILPTYTNEPRASTLRSSIQPLNWSLRPEIAVTMGGSSRISAGSLEVIV